MIFGSSGFGFGLPSAPVAIKGGAAALLQLGSSSISESAAPGATVGALTVTGGSGSYTFTKTADPDSKFSIVGGNLVTSAALDFETKTQHSVTVQASNGSQTLSKTFNISVTNVVEGTIGPTTAGFSTTDAAGAVIAVLSGLDAGANETIASIAPNDGRLAFTGNQLIKGLSASTGGQITATVTMSTGRTVTIVITVTQPATFVPTGIMAFGDSRLQKSAAYTSSGSTFSQSRLFSGGFLLAMEAAIDYKLLASATGVYAVGASTTRNGTLRLSSVSNAITGNTASTETGDSADAAFNSQSTGEYSPLTDPANVVLYMYGVNDGSYTTYFNDPKKTMLEIASHLDQFTAADKFVLLFNETPGGRGYIQNEVKAVSGLACQTTQTSAVSVVHLVNKDTGVRYSKVTTLTAVGQFAVSASGAITFYTGDTIANAQIDYNYGATVSGVYRNTVHNWLSSNDAVFIDPDSNVNYAIPGALYGRSKVRSVNIWDVLKNPATSGANTVNKDGVTPDILHINTYGAITGAAPLKAVLNELFPTLTRKDKQVTQNSVLFATGNNTLTSFSGTLPATGMVPVPTGKLKVIAGAINGVDDGAGNIVGTGISGTINYATGALSLTFAAAPANGVYIEVSPDLGSNLILHGLLDPAQGNGTVVPTGIIGLPPKGWSVSSMDADLQAAVTAGTATVTLDTTQTDPVSGLPELRVSIKGVVGGSAGSAGNLSLANLIRTPANRLATGSTGDKVRATGVTRVLPGPGGTVQGNLGGQVKAQLQTSVAVTRPGANGAGNNTAVTIASATAGAGAAGTPFDDQDLVAGQFRMALLTTPVDASGMTLTNAQLNALVQFEKAKYLDLTVCFSQLGVQVY